MNRSVFSFLIGLAVIVLSGCQTTGLSLREKDGFNYSRFLYSAYGQAVQGPEEKVLRLPITLSVAQIGEDAPTAAFLDKVQARRGSVAKVQTLPAAGYKPVDSAKPEVNQLEVETMVFKMKMLAKDLGTDYLFIYGGSADYGSNPNFLSFFDMTLIGMYLVPGMDHVAEGKASGALIDVRTGKVVFIVSAQSKISKSTPSYGSYYSYDNPALSQLRDDLVGKLADQLLEKLSS